MAAGGSGFRQGKGNHEEVEFYIGVSAMLRLFCRLQQRWEGWNGRGDFAGRGCDIQGHPG